MLKKYHTLNCQTEKLNFTWICKKKTGISQGSSTFHGEARVCTTLFSIWGQIATDHVPTQTLGGQGCYYWIGKDQKELSSWRVTGVI